MFIGEGPGEKEDQQGIPFVGASGQVLTDLLARAGLSRPNVYITNLIKRHIFRNLDPLPEEIEEDAPYLAREMASVQPSLVVAVGAYAGRHLLQDPSATMERMHGMLYAPPDTPYKVFCAMHPASMLHDTDQSARLYWDFDRLRKALDGDLPVHKTKRIRTQVVDVSDVAAASASLGVYDLGVDTEFDPYVRPPRPWGLTISCEEGKAAAVKANDQAGLRVTADIMRGARHIFIHNYMADAEPLAQMLPDLPFKQWLLPESSPRILDSMVMIFHEGNVQTPQGLKAAAYRLLGAEMGSFEEMLSPTATRFQINYLTKVSKRTYPDPKPTVEIVKDKQGRERLKFGKPWSLNRRVNKIVDDWFADPSTTKLDARWNKIDDHVRKPAEDLFGLMPVATVFDAPQDEATQYACEDADATRRIGPILHAQAKASDLLDVLDLDMSPLALIARMETNGMPADPAYFLTLGREMRARQREIHREIEQMVGHAINPNSPDQVALTLFDELGLTSTKRTSTGKASTSRKVLTPLRHENEVVDKILDFKTLSKIDNAFCGNLAKAVSRQTRRCFATIRATRVKTGRLATSDPNLLAIPTRTDEGRRVRKGFMAPDGWLYGAFDLSQVEVRIACQRSLDKRLLAIYNLPKDRPKHERDVHIQTAAAVHGIDPRDVTDTQRTLAKSTCFGVIMGITGLGLLDQLRLYGINDQTEDDCDRFIVEWLNVHQGVKYYQLRQHALARRYGYIRDMFGRRYLLPGARSSASKVAAEALRQSHALDIQGSAQGLAKRIMTRLEYETIPKLAAEGIEIQPLIWIHDEIVILLPEEHKQRVSDVIVDVMVNTTGLIIPIEASSATAKTWGDLK